MIYCVNVVFSDLYKGKTGLPHELRYTTRQYYYACSITNSGRLSKVYLNMIHNIVNKNKLTTPTRLNYVMWSGMLGLVNVHDTLESNKRSSTSPLSLR